MKLSLEQQLVLKLLDRDKDPKRVTARLVIDIQSQALVA